jgi:hypothetical protein
LTVVEMLPLLERPRTLQGGRRLVDCPPAGAAALTVNTVERAITSGTQNAEAKGGTEIETGIVKGRRTRIPMVVRIRTPTDGQIQITGTVNVLTVIVRKSLIEIAVGTRVSGTTSGTINETTRASVKTDETATGSVTDGIVTEITGIVTGVIKIGRLAQTDEEMIQTRRRRRTNPATRKGQTDLVIEKERRVIIEIETNVTSRGMPIDAIEIA